MKEKLNSTFKIHQLIQIIYLYLHDYFIKSSNYLWIEYENSINIDLFNAFIDENTYSYCFKQIDKNNPYFSDFSYS